MLKQVVAVGFVAFLAYWILNYMIWMGLFQRTYNHSPGPCRRLEGIESGTEDMQVLPDGHAFISSGLRVVDSALYNSRPGRIYLFDFKQPNVAPQPLAIKAPKDIQLISVHGISLWTDKTTGNVYLYVVSHQKLETVDKFRVDLKSKTLTHVRRIDSDPNFFLLNDIVVIGEDQFFFTNYLYYHSMVELIVGVRWGSLGYFDGTRSKLLETGMFVPNGINISPDARHLYVAQLAGEDIRVYRRHDNNSLTFRNTIQLRTKLDNLDFDATTGDLWVGAHPKYYTLLQHVKDGPTILSPSQILRLKLSEDGETAVNIEEIYSNDGSQLSASSVAVRYGRAFLIGSVSTHALICEMQ